MIRLAEIFQQGFDAYKQKFPTLPKAHIEAAEAIMKCRNGEGGGHVYHCQNTHCGHDEFKPHSCGHVSCPQCRQRKRLEWTLMQKTRLLKVCYFHLVFTVPAGLREVSKRHQRVFLELLFSVTAKVVKRFSKDPKWLGGNSGFMSFLHTWGDSLIWHPHIHMLMPAVAINDAGKFVYPNNSAFLFPVHAMSAVFKAEFLKALRKALPDENIPYFDKKYKWVEYCEGVKQDDAKHVIDYLGRYFNRTAISEQRLLSFDDHSVSFSYRKERKGNEAKTVSTMTLKRDEFFRRFLQHVPWKGMHRVRYYGFLHPSQKRKLQRMQLVLCDSKFIVELSEVEAQLSELRKQDWICCSECGSQMKISHTLNRFQAFVNLRAPPCAI
jgi:hypothetical protein